MIFRLGSLSLISCTILLHTIQAEVPVVRVRVQIYSDLGAGILQRAERDAADIFRQSGIELRWLGPGQLDGDRPPDIDLVILPDAMARKLRATPDQFGLAVFAGRAYIFLDRLISFAKDELAPVNQLLGPAIAHELGHLLLGPNSHFTVGIMRGRWRKADVKNAFQGSLIFTAEQGQIMRRGIGTRDEILVAEHSADVGRR